MSTLFNRAKTATILGVVLFFAGYMPFFAVGTDTATAAAKLASSLLSPTAFALVINLAGTYEDAGAGVQWANLNNLTSGYTISSGKDGCTSVCFCASSSCVVYWTFFTPNGKSLLYCVDAIAL